MTTPDNGSAIRGAVDEFSPAPTLPPDSHYPKPPENLEPAPPSMDGDTTSVPDLVEQAAKEFNVPPSILHDEAQRESQFNQNAESNKGAQGVMQLMPQTAKALGVNPNDTRENIRGGAQYLKQLHDQFGDWDHALAAYDWGPRHVRHAVKQYGDGWLDHAPRETQNYVNSILHKEAKSDEPEAIEGEIQTPPQQETYMSAKKPTFTDRIWNTVKEGIPEFNKNFELASHTDTGTLTGGEHPKMQLVTPQAALTPEEQKKHPMATAALETVGSFTTPTATLGMAAAPGLSEVGELPGIAGKLIPKLVSLGFSAGALKGAYNQIPSLKKAMDAGDESQAKNILTHMVIDTAMGAYAGQHGLEGAGETLKDMGQGVKESAERSITAKTPAGREPEAGRISLSQIPGAVPVKESTESLPEDEYLYHATDKSRAESIENNGLRKNSWFARTPQDAMRSGAVPVSGNRGDLRVYAVPKSEITPSTPDTADIGSREAEKGRFVQSSDVHIPSHEVTGNGHIVKSMRPEGIEAGTPKLSPEQAVNAAGGVFKGTNSAGLVEITLPRSMTDKLVGVPDRLRDFVSITMPKNDVTPETVKTAMENKFKDFGGNPEDLHTSKK